MAEAMINEQNFAAEVLQSKEPVMIDFAAAWCGPCKMMAPVIHELANEVAGVKIATVDVDEQSGLGQQYNIRPADILFSRRQGHGSDDRCARQKYAQGEAGRVEA